ncbi:MAG: succinate dehydrogenase/fumarate reductase iron-sulfur subunit [Propionibacteriaceae bacterium]|nr:succinate dehydrogenase/fumarate reductase iron-sulfur subunit [Propionibacteriaceae bacterium]
MKIELRVWRQSGPKDPGRFETYEVDASEHLSLLDLLDAVNDRLVAEGREPIAYESDCREGICGACGVTVDGSPHGPVANTPSCRQHVRSLTGSQITIEPFRSAAFPVVKDLVVDRSALTELMGVGSVAVNAGTAPDADALPSGHDEAEEALDFAACIGCGACVAACPNGAANLFAGAKLAHLALIPQGRVERRRRAREMTKVLDEHFGPCSSFGECVETCPAGIDLRAIAALHRERLWHWRR